MRLWSLHSFSALWFNSQWTFPPPHVENSTDFSPLVICQRSLTFEVKNLDKLSFSEEAKIEIKEAATERQEPISGGSWKKTQDACSVNHSQFPSESPSPHVEFLILIYFPDYKNEPSSVWEVCCSLSHSGSSAH